LTEVISVRLSVPESLSSPAAIDGGRRCGYNGNCEGVDAKTAPGVIALAVARGSTDYVDAASFPLDAAAAAGN